jgi:hypothetical protein
MSNLQKIIYHFRIKLFKSSKLFQREVSNDRIIFDAIIA